MTNPEIKHVDELRVIGYEINADYVPGSDKNAAYWTQIDFTNYPPFPPEMNDLGDISTWKHPAGELERLCYYFGCLTDLKEAPAGFTEFTIPAGEFAVFTASETVPSDSREETAKKVRETVATIFKGWLGEASGYQYDIDHGMLFEFYKDNAAYVYIPVKKV